MIAWFYFWWLKMVDELKVGNSSYDHQYDMQEIGKFLRYASRGDRVGLNLMLIKGISPNVQDYDNRTALHLAASEGHAPIVELLLHYKANVNLIDRWQRTVSCDIILFNLHCSIKYQTILSYEYDKFCSIAIGYGCK